MQTEQIKVVNNFGERVRQLRIQKGMSQIELGKVTDTHHTQIGRYELGKARPNSKTLKLLADALDVSTDYLFDGIEEDAVVVDFKDKELLYMFSEIENFCDEDKKVLKSVIEAYIKKNQHEQVSNRKLTSTR